MKANTPRVIGSFFLVLFTYFADVGDAGAGGAAAAAVGPSSVGGATGSADGDGSGYLKKINQYSVKSYTLMRQLLATSGTKAGTTAEGK